MAPPKWPGLTFDMDSDAAKVLLQTPNGKGVAWLLVNHKKAFGVKTVGKVQLWNASKGGDAKCRMLFYVEDVA